MTNGKHGECNGINSSKSRGGAGPQELSGAAALKSSEFVVVIGSSLCKTKLAALQRLQSRARAIMENAKIKDGWSCSWLNVENIIRYQPRPKGFLS